MGSAQLARSLGDVTGVALRALGTGTDFESALGDHTAEFIFAVRSAAVIRAPVHADARGYDWGEWISGVSSWASK